MKAADPQGLRGLARLARQARRRAHAPFSRFKVGAALRTRTGEVVNIGIKLVAQSIKE